METPHRVERDLLGEINVPAGAYYGAQTQRAIRNFPRDGAPSIGDYPALIRALLQVKKAAASANASTGFLDEARAAAIRAAADRVLDSARFDQFPVHALHGGGGTSANMNVNEVLANVAEESMGGQRGEYRLVHPADHVNLNQSTNDVYPTACHLAILDSWPPVERALSHLARSFREQSARWAHEPHLARTCLQDAVQTTFGDLLGGYAAFVERAGARVALAVDGLHRVNLGGTIVGRPIDVPPRYFETIVEALRIETGRPRLNRPADLFDAAQHVDDMTAVSSSLALLARGTIKIAQDIRLLASGPEAGLGELNIPAVQPGSSIMPGKVNPVVPEFVMQVCMRVVGHDAACQMAVDHGELDLNVWESVVLVSTLDSLSLLAPALSTLATGCVDGFQPAPDRNGPHVDTIIPMLTRLMQAHGYAAINDICRRAGRDPEAIRRLLAEEGYL